MSAKLNQFDFEQYKNLLFTISLEFKKKYSHYLGIWEVEDLYHEAIIALPSIIATHDPDKSPLIAYIKQSIQYHLLTVTKPDRLLKTDPMINEDEEELEFISKSIHPCIAFLLGISEDAKMFAQLFFDTPDELIRLFLSSYKRRSQKYIVAEYMKISRKRINEIEHEIEDYLII